MRELMTALVETLDLEEIRGEMIRYALNSEVFYAFSVSYLISLLKKLASLSPSHLPQSLILSNNITRSSSTAAYLQPQPHDSDMKDLLKTI
jgi:hypothetical protein